MIKASGDHLKQSPKTLNSFLILCLANSFLVACSGDKGDTETKKPFACGEVEATALPPSACANDPFKDVNEAIGKSSKAGIYPDGSKAAKLSDGEGRRFIQFFQRHQAHIDVIAKVVTPLKESSASVTAKWTSESIESGELLRRLREKFFPEDKKRKEGATEPSPADLLFQQVQNNCFATKEGYQIWQEGTVDDGKIGTSGSFDVFNEDPACPIRLVGSEKYDLSYSKRDNEFLFKGAKTAKRGLEITSEDFLNLLGIRSASKTAEADLKILENGQVQRFEQRWSSLEAVSEDLNGTVQVRIVGASQAQTDLQGLMYRKVKAINIYEMNSLKVLLQVFGIEGRDGRSTFEIYLNGEKITN